MYFNEDKNSCKIKIYIEDVEDILRWVIKQYIDLGVKY